MDSAKSLYETLKSFKDTGDPGRTPQRLLLEYCTNVLGGVERLHVDYKEKHNRSNAKLDDEDKRNLAKALSGFANTGGGTLIWGIEDKTLVPKPIVGIEQFLSSLLALAPQSTDPPVPSIDGEWLAADFSATREGFAMVYVPESPLPPHRVILRDREISNHYYFRSGEDFLVASHTQLEDMFGRRPKPVLDLSTRIVRHGSSAEMVHMYVIIGIENKGRGSARSPFLRISAREPYAISTSGIDGNGRVGLTRLVCSLDSRESKYMSSEVVIHPGIVHDVTSVRIEVPYKQEASVIQDLVLDYEIAAENVIPIGRTITINGVEVWSKAHN